MTVQGTKPSRTQRPDLLARPPCGVGWDSDVAAMLVDPAAQLDVLADLFSRGLMSRDEFEREKLKVLHRFEY
jgi:hypothetical protein